MGIVLMPAAITDDEIYTPTTNPGGMKYAKTSRQLVLPAGAVTLQNAMKLHALDISECLGASAAAKVLSGHTINIYNGDQSNPLATIIGTAAGSSLDVVTLSGITPTQRSTNLVMRRSSSSGPWTGNTQTMNYSIYTIDISSSQLNGLDPKFVVAIGGGNNFWEGGGVLLSSSSDGSTAVDRGYLCGDNYFDAPFYLFSDNSSSIVYCSSNGIRMPVQSNYRPNSIAQNYYVYIVGVR